MGDEMRSVVGVPAAGVCEEWVCCVGCVSVTRDNATRRYTSDAVHGVTYHAVVFDAAHGLDRHPGTGDGPYESVNVVINDVMVCFVLKDDILTSTFSVPGACHRSYVHDGDVHGRWRRATGGTFVSDDVLVVEQGDGSGHIYFITGSDDFYVEMPVRVNSWFAPLMLRHAISVDIFLNSNERTSVRAILPGLIHGARTVFTPYINDRYGQPGDRHDGAQIIDRVRFSGGTEDPRFVIMREMCEDYSCNYIASFIPCGDLGIGRVLDAFGTVRPRVAALTIISGDNCRHCDEKITVPENIPWVYPCGHVVCYVCGSAWASADVRVYMFAGQCDVCTGGGFPPSQVKMLRL